MNRLDEPLISVIIPVYNVEEYLPKCVESVINQTYRNLEIWLVDDGSTDGSGEICDEYAKTDVRIRVIHKENGGLSDARNVALDQISGDYVTFIDSDDYVHEKMIEKLMDSVKRNHSDIAVCNMERVNLNEHNTEKPHDHISETVFDGADVFLTLFDDKYRETIVTACGKIYDRKIYDSIRFPKGRAHEDEYVIHHVLDQCVRIVILDEKLYYHVMREGSITMSEYSIKSLDAVDAIEDRCGFFEKKGDKRLLFLCYRDYLRRVQFHCYSMEKYFPEEQERISTIKRNYKNRYDTIKNEMSIKDRSRYGLFLWMPGVNKAIKSLAGARKV